MLTNMLKIKNISTEIKKIINFYGKKIVFDFKNLKNQQYIDNALEHYLIDISYRKKVKYNKVIDELLLENGKLAVFLYRLSRQYLKDKKISNQINFLQKTLCSCEIYSSSFVDEGFNIDHGFGLVIGSRSKIGKNFLIHQGCTVGHKSIDDLDKGPVIGDNVVMYANSMILGNLNIPSNKTLPANTIIK